MSIKVLKMVTGEEILTDVSENEDGAMVLNNPAKMIMVPTQEGGTTIGLMPWFPYIDDEDVTIAKSAIMITLEPPKEMQNEYRRIYGSGLDVPDTPKIIH